MDFNATIDIIIKDLEEARAIIDDLKKYQGVPALQIELARAKCKSAAEIMELLKTLNLNIQPPEAPVKIVAAKPIEPVKRANVQEKPSITKQFSEEPVIQKPKKTDAGTRNLSSANVNADEVSNVPEAIYGPEILADRFSTEDDQEYLKSGRLSSLSEAIGINDKFFFIREVFDDNLELYAQVVSKLETADNVEDAWTIIMSHTKDETSRKAGKQLLDLVKRKLRTDE